MKIALAGIVKNEFPYLLEWIAHHINIGIDHFIIANHGSTDGTTELLEALEKLGIVTTFFISAETEAPQLASYKKILEDHGKEYDWIGFLDADEFFLPEENKTLRQILNSINGDIGGILFNWAIYGSSFQKSPDHFDLPSPVTARFTWRASKKININKDTKCFVRPQAVALDKLIPSNNPHKLSLNTDWYYINSALKRIEHEQETSWKNARINHYIIKSKWEFANRKIPNGDAAFGNSRHKDWLYFQSLDLNDVFDPFPSYLSILRDRTIEKLEEELLVNDYQYSNPNKKNVAEQQERFLKEFESIQITKNELVIKGWIVDSNGKSPITEMEFVLKSNDLDNIEPKKILITKNKAAKKAKPYSSLRSGFELYFSLKELENQKNISLIVCHVGQEFKMRNINLDDLRINNKDSILSKVISRLFLNGEIRKKRLPF